MRHKSESVTNIYHEVELDNRQLIHLLRQSGVQIPIYVRPTLTLTENGGLIVTWTEQERNAE